MQHIRDLTSSTAQGPNMRLISPADLGKMVMFGIVSNIKSTPDLTQRGLTSLLKCHRKQAATHAYNMSNCPNYAVFMLQIRANNEKAGNHMKFPN